MGVFGIRYCIWDEFQLEKVSFSIEEPRLLLVVLKKSDLWMVLFSWTIIIREFRREYLFEILRIRNEEALRKQKVDVLLAWTEVHWKVTFGLL